MQSAADEGGKFDADKREEKFAALRAGRSHAAAAA
jgi:hypothetical protein